MKGTKMTKPQIESLTEEQKATFPFYIKKWTTIANSVVKPGFYTEEVIDKIKDAIITMYRDQGGDIKPENILVSPSPKMSPFIASARVYGKPGTPKKKLHCRLPDMKAVEDFINTFENPKEIQERAKDFCEKRYWGSIDAGFWGYVDFFNRETILKDTVLKPKAELISKISNVFVPCVFDLIYTDDFCVFSKKQVYQDLDTSGEYPVIKPGKIKWEDGTEIEY